MENFVFYTTYIIRWEIYVYYTDSTRCVYYTKIWSMENLHKNHSGKLCNIFLHFLKIIIDILYHYAIMVSTTNKQHSIS